ncbi:hypothetical protein GOODEAATRI_024756 [Goodea atripinnis]|uniref:Uncharacterized protein n=1 Tax=Goodea atripinnis TaxID=208336 RepID=A0ABV0P7L6_9TELE
MTSSSVTASFSAPLLIFACRQTHHILTHTNIMKGYKNQIVKLKKRRIYKINLYSIIPTVMSSNTVNKQSPLPHVVLSAYNSCSVCVPMAEGVRNFGHSSALLHNGL